jgi:hypothetical protein
MTNPILLEGAKVRQALINQALADPDMTLGFEAEFYVVNAFKKMAQISQKGAKLSKDRFWYTKKLGDLEWHDLFRYFYPMEATLDGEDNQEVIKFRLSALYHKNFPDDPERKFRNMFKKLIKKFPPYDLITLLRVYPEEGFEGLDDQTQAITKKLIRRGDRFKMSAYKSLNDVSYRTHMIGEEKNAADANDSRIQLEVFYHVLADALSEYLGEPVIVSLHPGEVRGETKDYSTWAITLDDSLNINEFWKEGMIGVEIVSPIKQAAEGIHALHRVLLFIQNIGRYIPGTSAETNQATGLHINIGKKNAQVDYVKLLFLMGDAYVAQNYDRLQFNKGDGDAINNGVMAAQTYYEMIKNFSQKPELIRLLNSLTGQIKLNRQDIQTVMDLLRRSVPKGKYFRVNLTKLDQGYIEFRAAGNSDYEDRWPEIEDTCLHLVVMMHVATTPEVYRREFLTKLYKVAVEAGRKHFEKQYQSKQFFPKAAE